MNGGSSGQPLGASATISRAIREHRWFAGAAALALLLFGTILTQGTGNLVTAEYFSDFYDYQAASLLQGRLDVPDEAITFEAFIHEGKAYGYFGLTPALLRIPWVALDLGFGKTSRAWMLAYYAAALLAGYQLLREATRRRGPLETPSPGITVLFVANAGVANTAFFLGSRAYVFHEAILCGIACALWSIWATLRHLRDPDSRWWLGALITGVLSLHARPPTGLFALTVLGLAGGWLAWTRRRDTGPAGGITVVLLAAVGIASFNGISYLKFGTIDGCPLRLNVQYDAARLARIDGRQFHLSNLPFSANAYLFRHHAALSVHFPYVRLTSPDPRNFPSARIDLSEPIMGLPFVMPGLFLLSLLGLAGLLRGEGEGRAAVLLIWCGIIPVGLALFAAIAVSHRYTADFVPFLIAAAAFGCASLRQAGGFVSRAARTAAASATLVAVPLNLALTLQYQGEGVWGVPDEIRVRYAQLRQAVDGWFDVPNPSGYDIRNLKVRTIEADLLNYASQALASRPDLQPTVVAYCRRIIAIRPEDPLVHARLGNALLSQGKAAEAVGTLEQAVRLGPQLPLTHHSLGTAYLMQNRVPEALAQFEAALRLDPRHEPTRGMLQRLGLRLEEPR